MCNHIPLLNVGYPFGVFKRLHTDHLGCLYTIPVTQASFVISVLQEKGLNLVCGPPYESVTETRDSNRGLPDLSTSPLNHSGCIISHRAVFPPRTLSDRESKIAPYFCKKEDGKAELFHFSFSAKNCKIFRAVNHAVLAGHRMWDIHNSDLPVFEQPWGPLMCIKDVVLEEKDSWRPNGLCSDRNLPSTHKHPPPQLLLVTRGKEAIDNVRFLYFS